MTVEAARAGDGEQVGHLLAAAHAPAHQQLTVWSSPRIGRYVEDLIEGSLPQESPAFTVIRRHGVITGVVYLRSILGGIFIDSLYADETTRKEQLTNLLIYRSLVDYSRPHPSPVVRFDVFESKRAVRAWQQRILGAREGVRRTWWRLPLPEEGRADGKVTGLPDADRIHERWGFSKLQVATTKGTYTVGRLPGPYFRLAEPLDAHDPALFRTLASLDPARELFVTGEKDRQAEGGRRIDVLIRSRVELPELLRRLKAQTPSWMLESERRTHSTNPAK
jgi:hypothetical protein